MSFKISQLVNQYLKDAAIVADKNCDGIVANGEEVSIFVNKSSELKREGLVDERVYIDEISHNIYDNIPLGEAGNCSSEDLKLRKEKEVMLEIEIHEHRLNKLLKLSPKEKFEKRTHAIESVAASLGGGVGLFAAGFSGAKLGASIGLTIGPVGIAVCAFSGMLLGIASGIYAGNKLGESLITEDDIKNAKQEIQASIDKEEKILNNLRKQLDSLK